MLQAKQSSKNKSRTTERIWKHSKTQLQINDMPQRIRTYTTVRETIIANTESVEAPLQTRINKNRFLFVIPPLNKNKHLSTRNILNHWNLSTRKIFRQTKADLPDALLAHHRWHCNIARTKKVVKIKRNTKTTNWKLQSPTCLNKPMKSTPCDWTNSATNS